MAGASFLCRYLLLPMAVTTMVTALVLRTSISRTVPYNRHDVDRKQFRNDDNHWYYRRRTRYLMATTEEQGKEQARQDTDDVIADNKDEQSSLASCPFSKTFPRYRIDLTMSRKDRKNKQKEGIWSLIPSVEMPSLELPSPPWKEAMQRDQLERAVRNRDKRRTGNSNVDMEILIQPSIDGISAFAFLWEQAARLIGLREGSFSSSVVVIGLPDASKPVVQNFCEILEWMMTEMIDNETENNTNFVRDGFVLDVDFIKEENLEIPALRLELITTPMVSRNNGQNKISTESNAFEKVINERTRLWVKRILVEQGICPFTRSDRMSGQGLVDLGVPVGSIAYHASFQRHPIGLFADTWAAIEKMIEAGPEGRSGVSSILLAAPEFDDDFDIWAGPIFAMLEAGVVAAGAESQVGVVCFHPRYATPDGKSWPGFGQMHSVPRLEKWYRETSQALSGSSECPLTTEQIAAGGAWQRRTPHATINVLRADQLAVAESRRVSGTMYTENIDKLVGFDGIGNEKLTRDLEHEREQGAN